MKFGGGQAPALRVRRSTSLTVPRFAQPRFPRVHESEPVSNSGKGFLVRMKFGGGQAPAPRAKRSISLTVPRFVQQHRRHADESDLESDSGLGAPRSRVPNRCGRGRAPAPSRRRKTPPCKQRHSARRALLKHFHRAYCTIYRSLSRRALQRRNRRARQD